MAPRDTSKWAIGISDQAERTINPLRYFLLRLSSIETKRDVINLTLGDPTVFHNLKTHYNVIESIEKSLHSFKFNGYAPTTGYASSCAAVAQKYSSPTSPLTAKDVILTSGCSGALEMCIDVLANKGQNILIPKPGFPLYTTLSNYTGVECRYYSLKPENNWEIDLDEASRLIDDQTVAILINNPSNPCGSVFSHSHLLEILSFCEKHKLPIIADEIYGNMVFEGHPFYSFGSLSTNVPVLAVGGLAKEYLVPGWRVGWIIIHDRHDAFKHVRKGITSLSMKILGANTLAQGSLPDILQKTPPEFFQSTNALLQKNAMLCFEKLSSTPGLKPIEPQGSMYMMVGIDVDDFSDIKDDTEFVEKLYVEEGVLCFPGECFKCPRFIRIVTCPPDDILVTACDRIKEFCSRHYQSK